MRLNFLFNQQSQIPHIANAPQPLSEQAPTVRTVLEKAFGEAPTTAPELTSTPA